MGIHYDYKSKRGERAMLKEAKRKARLAQKKMKSFAHGEFNKSNLTNPEIINEKINKGKDIFDREISYKKVQIDNSFPKYIVDNKEKFKEWII